MIENVQEEPSNLSAVCADAVIGYREAGKAVQAPAIRKVIESVLRQKIEHVSALRPLDALFSGSLERLSIPSGAEPEDVLRHLVSHETGFAASLDSFSASLDDLEARQSVKGIADCSRKFASWAQDHLDLLAMF
ncbi:MAG TPA: hypothetical protein PLQ29_11040 [Spirochaetales bacterium]|nr:hypothetical protein [Spirochaetales bacterium]HPG87224.1 hypothetical protein [Spirochaetales bacterium]